MQKIAGQPDVFDGGGELEGFGGGRTSGDFTDSHVQLAQLITPVLANAYSHILLKKKSALSDDIFEIVASQLQRKPYIIFSSDLESVYRSDQMTLLGRQLRSVGDSINDIFARSLSIAISPCSVKNHLKNIYRKTGVNSRASLAQIVSRSG